MKHAAISAEKINSYIKIQKHLTMDMKLLLLPISSLNRVGPAVTKLLTGLVGQNKVSNLLLHKPNRGERILIAPNLFEVENNALVIIKAKVETHIKPGRPRQPHKIICRTPSGYISLIFFKIFPSQISKMPIGSDIAILGNLEKTAAENKITHPQEILPADQTSNLPQINVIYPLSGTISQKLISGRIRDVLKKVDDQYEEWIDVDILKKYDWVGFGSALKTLHYFASADFHSARQEKARKRLAYDELLAWQIASIMAKSDSGKTKKFSQPDKDLVTGFLNSLPFQATNAQLKSIKDITSEICSEKKMLRLLQGDVGSGKTLVAIASALQTISQHKQSCIIAPTTVLAKQHMSYFSNFLKDMRLNIELITSATTKKQKEKLAEKLREGKINILIGTHAILEDDIQFKNLGLAIIDEQHRFGVMQRLKLVEKGSDVDTLLMSATPIPRSLMMGLYGDMDISVLDEKPKNRQEIETLVMSEKKSKNIYDAVNRTIAKGEKIYWICPAIENLEEGESAIELANVTAKFTELSAIFGEENITLLHGKMKEKEKDKIMHDFSDPAGKAKLLISTTVIEVGVDVPDATVIVIENAEHFGLSQLHQLRGRVGRSDKKSFCILLYGKRFSANGRARLNILRQSNDGFFIAEEDLKMRGSGELLGTKQSGFPEFRIADLGTDNELLKLAYQQANKILNTQIVKEDRELMTKNNAKYRYLLQFFNHGDCLEIMHGG